MIDQQPLASNSTARCRTGEPAGTYLIGASGINPTVREITTAASVALGLDGRLESKGVASTLDRLGLLGEALLLDQPVVSTGADVIGWRPSRPTMLEHIASTIAREDG